MGLFDRFKRITDPVDGTAQVVSATGAPDGQGSAACDLHLVVTVPGVPAFPVRGTYMVKMAKWPWPGMVLPITTRADPTRFKIRWDRVPTGADAAVAQAARLADLSNQQASGGPMPDGGSSGSGVGPDRLDRLERLAALHRSGALSADEYEKLKGEILDG